MLDSDAIRRRARVLLDLGRPADALLEVRRALADNPNDSDALEIEGLCFLRLRSYPEALDSLARAIARAPQAAHAHYLYGFAQRESGQRDEAEAPFKAALLIAPEEPVYLRALAELYSDQGRHEQGLVLARRAAELGADRASNHVTLGYVASNAGDKGLARIAYEQAVALDPSDAAAWNNLGCLDLAAGDLLRARARFREALRLDPRGERAQRNLTLVLPTRRPTSHSWAGLLEAVGAELVRAKAGKLVLAALLMEAPDAGRSFARGGERGAALTGGATLLLLRLMGPAAILPLSLGAAAVGVAWLATRDRLPAERERVRRALGEARARFDQLWQDWLAGKLLRDARDAAIDQMVEDLTLTLAKTELT